MKAENHEIDLVSSNKHSYSSPVLVRYGAVSDLTQAGSTSSNEAASNPCPQIELTMSFNAMCQ